MVERLEPGDPATVGPYRLVGRLGSGGMGHVYLARSRAGRPVAVKVVRPELAGDPVFRARFGREVAAARRVSGAFTTPVVDADPDASRPWLATAYVPGPSLDHAVATHGPMPEDALRRLLAGLAEALAAIHAAGLVHRDLKPSNILLARDGPRVIDFGIARTADATALTATGIAVGTPAYMSPEQCDGRTVGPASDVFALGAVVAFAATGRPPFGTGLPHAVAYRVAHQDPDLAEVPPSLRAVLMACLDKDATRRPAPGALTAALSPPGQDWLSSLTTPLTAEITDQATQKWVRGPGRRRLLIGGAAAAGTLAVGGVGAAAAVASGKNPKKTKPRHPSPVRLWSGEGVKDGAPVVVGGTLLSCGDAGVTALDAAIGARRWTVSGAFSFSDPASPAQVNGGFCVVRDHRLCLLDLATGTIKWTYEPPGIVPLEVVGLHGSVALCARDKELTAFAVDIGAKSVRWQNRKVDCGMAALSPSGDRLYTSDLDHIVGTDTATGAQGWRVPFDPMKVMTVRDGTLFVCGDGLHALDTATGKKRWTFRSSNAFEQFNSLMISGQTAYVAGDNLHAVDTATGRLRWQLADRIGPQELAIAGAWVIGGVDDDTPGGPGTGLYGWDAATGAPRWRYPAKLPPDTGWLLYGDGDRLYAGSGTSLTAFRIPR